MPVKLLSNPAIKLKLKNQRVMVRVDFNVPIKNGKIEDDSRLLASLPTLKYLIEAGARVILVTHVGRPEGKAVEELKVDPIIARLGELLSTKVNKLASLQVEEEIKDMKSGDVVMLENIRFYPEEEKNDPEFAKQLASLADYFVLDGFAVAHRDAASVTGVSKYVGEGKALAGLLLEKEIKGLEKVMQNPEHPFVVVLGGVKIETKIPIIKNLLDKADYILLGGGLTNTYFKAKGYDVGSSLVDEKYLDMALEYCDKKKVIKPVDVVVGTKDGLDIRILDIVSKFEIRNSKLGIYDIGPQTIELYKTYIAKAKTLVWNGALGYLEQKPYDTGTLEIARAVASRSSSDDCFGVIGGGETLQAMDLVKGKEKIDLVSTGGGAMLEFLAGKKLPGIEALENN